MTRPTSSVLTATWRVACVSEQQVTATRLFFRYTSPAKSTRSASSFERLLWPTFPYPLAPRRRCAAPAWPVAATLAGCGPMQDPARSLGAGCVRCQGRYPRGPRLDVLWSSLPKRERVLLRRYGRKVRSDRGDCQIGPLRRRSCMTEVKHYRRRMAFGCTWPRRDGGHSSFRATGFQNLGTPGAISCARLPMQDFGSGARHHALWRWAGRCSRHGAARQGVLITAYQPVCTPELGQ